MDLAVLRTAKAALEEGLINVDDFENVKGSFLKAQAIKAGRDAGIIAEGDFAEARQAFFKSMGIEVVPSAAVNAVPAPSSHPAVVLRSEPIKKSEPIPAAAKPAEVVAPASAAPMPVSSRPPPVPALGLNIQAPEQADAAPDSARTDSTRGAPSASLPETPTSIPDYGGASATAGKASMSGIQVHADSVNIVGEMRIRKKYRWIVFKIGQGGKQVEIDRCGGPTSTFEEFTNYMPDNECRYGVYDYEYRNKEGTIYGKLVFVSWAPEVAPIKAKMQHASTKDFFRGFLDGISVELHATDSEELDESAVRERVANMVAKK